MKSKIAILASGSGSTAEAVIRSTAIGEVNYEIKLVIVSRENAWIFSKIKKLNDEFNLSIETKLINHHTNPVKENEQPKKGIQTNAEEQAILTELENSEVDLVALMGYMKKIGPKLVYRFGWREDYKSPYQAMMLNTHPGLLPDTKALFGANIQQYVLDNHLPFGGQSLHVVAEEYDDGPVVNEHKVAVIEGDTTESLFERVQQTEKHYLPGDIEQFIISRHNYLNEG